MNKLAVAAVAVFSRAAAAGPCAFPTPYVTVLGVPSGQTIDQSGGIVVGVESEFTSIVGSPRSIDKLDWTFGGKLPKVTLLAPDLAVLAPATPAKELVLADGKKTQLAAVTYAEVLARIATPAPKVTAIVFSSSTGPRSSSQSTVARLAAPPPAGTVAVLYYKQGEQKAGKPARGWAKVNVAGDPKLTQVVLNASSRCSAPVGGGEGSGKGDKLVLVWLDVTGHVSTPSAEFTVK